ncbi:MAG: class I SAM-dependent methyltransferase [Candidatus Micrarchaeota archaeon]|nr:class I SAM-dependent methyltransferase [Candidatus Micrarchaeota archaeon]
MGNAKVWEKVASISNDRGEYWPELDSRVATWNREEENFIKSSLRDARKRVLDLGCGDGRALMWLKEKGFRELYGLDISKTCIRRAKEKLGDSADLRVWDFKTGLPYEMKFDYVLLTGNTVINDLEKPAKLLEDVKGVMKDNGLLFITCWNGEFLTKKFVNSYYGKLGVVKVREVDMDNRTIDVGGIKVKWLVEKELRKIIEDAGLEIVSLKKASLGFLCAVSR